MLQRAAQFVVIDQRFRRRHTKPIAFVSLTRKGEV